MNTAASRVLAGAALVLVLNACGSSSAPPMVTSPGTDTQTSSAVGTSVPHPTQSSLKVAGCRNVPPPASREGEQASEPSARLDPTRAYTVRLATNCGVITISLAVKEAPKTTSSFAHLVQIGYYNGLTFHRVVPGFVIQGGDPNGNGTGGPNWKIVEPPPANLRYTFGVVAMAKGADEPSGTSSSQFFIVTGSDVNLPPVYALVGHVVGGARTVAAIAHVPTEAPPEGGPASRPRVPIVIERATLSVH